MTMNRRTLLAGATAALITPTTVQAAAGQRVFDIYRDDKKIGSQTLAVSRSGRQVRVDINIDINVRILGLSAYSYALSSRELWENGMLRTLKATTNDNGNREFANAERVSGGLQIVGSGFKGLVPGNPGTTTYWAKAFLQRPVWINTQNGQPMNVPVRKVGTVSLPVPGGSVQAHKYDCLGDLDTLDLYYDTQREWVGNSFEARGERARFVLASKGRSLDPLWVDA